MKKNFNIDLKNRKILYQLDTDSNRDISKIGKAVGLSKEVTNYRIKNLLDKIITSYQIVANLSKIGIIQFKVLLVLQHISSNKINELIEKLKKKEEVKWIAQTKGNWDLIISLETNSLCKVNFLKDEILSLFDKSIYEKSISILTECSSFNRTYLLDNACKKKEFIIVDESQKTFLDEKKEKILNFLSKNPKIKVIGMASKLNMSSKTIRNRVKDLIKTKIISGFKISLNHEILGIKFYKIFIYLENPKHEKVNELVAYLKNHKNVIHYVRVIGSWDLEPEIEANSDEEFNTILKDIKDRFQDIIKKVDVVTISKEHKIDYF